MFLFVLLSSCGGGGGRQANVPVLPPGNAPSPPPAGADANLANLEATPGSLDQLFQPSLRSYTMQVGFLTSSIRVVAAVSDPAADLTLNTAPLSSGVPSGPIPLVEGLNTINLEVTGADGMTRQSYELGVTRRPLSSFSQRAYLKSSASDSEDYFGTSMDGHADTLAVGVPSEDSGIAGDPGDNSLLDSGAVFVFVRSSTGDWHQQDYLKPDTFDSGDRFGSSVAVHGDLLAVGALGEDSSATGVGGDETDNGHPDSGAVYVFARDSTGNWAQEAFLKASNSGDGERFGETLTLQNNTLIIGSTRFANLVGRVWVFERDSAGIWTEVDQFQASDGTSDSAFGFDLDLQDDTLAVGAPYHGGIGNFYGAVYVFNRNTSGLWQETAMFRGPNTDRLDSFGQSVALTENMLAVAAGGESSAATGIDGDQLDNNAAYSGAVYLFVKDSNNDWLPETYFKASNTDSGDFFGSQLAFNGDRLLVSASAEDSASTGVGGDQGDNGLADAGAVYGFSRDSNGTWTQDMYVKSSSTGANDVFGRQLVLTEIFMAVGAPFEDSRADGINGDDSDNAGQQSGAVYVFE
ncbi:MAG: cadherin-like beta sandwich domain-containing protein [Pseudomonadales bacterium]